MDEGEDGLFGSTITRRAALGRLGSTAVIGTLALSGCGGGGGSPAQPAVQIPTTPPPPPPPAPAPPPPPPAPASAGIERLKRALAGSQGPRRVMASDPLRVTVERRNTTSIPSASVISKTDANIRFIGSRRERRGGYPGELFTFPTSTTYNPSLKTAGAQGYEFRPTTAEFEVEFLDVGGPTFLGIEIDGVATNDGGYDLGPGNTGGFVWARVRMPDDFAGRRVRLLSGNRPMGDLYLPAGGALRPVAAERPSDVVFIGDSITEGAVATRVWRYWTLQAAARLGIDNPISSGVGGSGYLTAITRTYVSQVPDNTYRERINDVLQAVDNGPPDAVFVSGGGNDLGKDPDAVGAEALRYFRELRAGAPNMVIFVTTPWGFYATPGGTPELNALRDRITAAAVQVSNTHVIDVTGLITILNRDVLFDGNKNGPHPIDAGHAYYGQFVAERAEQIIRSL